ncbi:hypothetical protein CMEL01_01920 [Colletotrichum melonis]|uniref:Uncharacterized protein n=1 Tax=Colletotrichum melonis TaxID=1209925 RepID=A0AAI9XQB3_9PEZI|nr:hypothetical protein CMEL01_01920 [Colletotrichum melonis]
MGIWSWWKTYLGEGDDPSLLVFLLRRKRRWLKGSLSPQRVLTVMELLRERIKEEVLQEQRKGFLVEVCSLYTDCE